MTDLIESAFSTSIKLHFKFIPGFAKFLLENRLKEYTAEQIRLSRAVKLSLLRFFESWTEEQVFQLTLDRSREFLSRLSDNDAGGYLASTLQRLESDEIPMLSKEDVQPIDLSLVSYVRKCSLVKFLQDYTQNIEEYSQIINEIDLLSMEIESRVRKVLGNIHDQLHRQTEELSHIGNWTWDLNTNKLYWSDELYRIYELPIQSVIDFEKINLFNHPDDAERVDQTIRGSIENNRPYDFYYRIRLKNGIERILRARGRTIAEDHSRPSKLLGTVQDVTDQKTIEESLNNHQNFIQKIANAVPSIISVYDIHTGQYGFINEALKSILGYDAENVMEKGIHFLTSLVHPDDIDRLMMENDRALEYSEQHPSRNGEHIAEFKYRVKHLDGSYRWLRTYGTIFSRDSENKPVQVMNISMDVTGEMTVKTDLDNERVFADLLIENSPDMILAYDKQFRIMVWNRKCEEHTGVKKNEAIGRNTFDLFPEYRTSQWIDSMKEVFNGKSLHYPRIKLLHGEGYGESFVMPMKNSLDEIQGLLSITRDITEQVRNEQQLEKRNEEIRRSEERYIRMTEEVVDYAVLLLDKEGIIENWNRGAQKIKGYDASEIIGKNFRIFYTKEDRERKLPETLINQAREKGRATHEGWRVRKDGTVFWGSIVITALHDSNNELIGFSKVTRDLTERKLAEDRMIEHARNLERKNEELEKINKELESFNYICSHDLQEPLRKIQSLSSRILDREYSSLSEKGRDYFNRMISSANRMQRLIEDLLALSRATGITDNFKEVDLNEMIEDVKNILQTTIDETHAVIEADRLPLIRVIPFQFAQLFQNLISNSLKFRKEGRQPRIKISGMEISGSEIKLEGIDEKKKYLKLLIADNGIGFKQQYAERIFDLFQRLHRAEEFPGTGIGLAICKKIVQNHSGFISARGIENTGAEFEIIVPLSPEN